MVLRMLCVLSISPEAALGDHAAGTYKGSAGVWSAPFWSRISLPETRSPGIERNQVQSVHSHQHGPDLAAQERTGESGDR